MNLLIIRENNFEDEPDEKINNKRNGEPAAEETSITNDWNSNLLIKIRYRVVEYQNTQKEN